MTYCQRVEDLTANYSDPNDDLGLIVIAQL